MKVSSSLLSFGEKIRQIRVNKGLHQEDLAKAINTSKMFVSRLERGQADYDAHMLANIRKFYGIENAPIFDHELEDYRNRLWVCNDLITAQNLQHAKTMLATLSPIMELPFERDLTLLYLMTEARILFREENLEAGEERLNRTEALLDEASSEALHLYHYNRGFLLLIRRDHKASLRHHLQCLNHENNNVKLGVGVLYNIGTIYLQIGKPWQALTYLEYSKMKYDLGRTNILESSINTNLALAYTFVGEYEKAESLYNDALAQVKSTNNDLLTGIALASLSFMYLCKGNNAESLKAYNKSLILVKNHSIYVKILTRKAFCLVRMKDFAQCKEVIEQCRELNKDDKNLAISIEAISHIMTLDNSESADHLENFVIPHFRTSNDFENGGIYRALTFCEILEAHYRKKRKIKKANEIAVVGRDIYKEIYFGGVDFE